MRMRTLRNSRQLWSRTRLLAPRGFRALARTVPATPERIRQVSHTMESKETAQTRYYLTTSSPYHSWLRRFGPAAYLGCELSRRHAEQRTLEVCRSCVLRYVLFRPVIDLTFIGAVYQQKHDWAPRKYERCLAVIERPYGDAPSSTHHQHPSEVTVGIEWRPEVPHTLLKAWSQPAKVDLLRKFYELPLLLGGLQKRLGKGWRTWVREATRPGENMLYSTQGDHPGYKIKGSCSHSKGSVGVSAWRKTS
ncbi:BZ3500_MvSof-1268-A1-R1_Chr4-3g07418 [Microbotryum saponariae]|uniref:BZ3500_MvSof-1268-A1-R1_Chr4-3g07418 protein n=1 Tax=Microbotryum saponariae TaxID=289078 RepID=A0A2X0KZ08_9BASI|nr:BZ3500_MvSof-1268-A1-R1_Chr4-3g07418 [Microbotryum saponariae]SDA07081.1 BZ3501_MvSof-1269-A2-R1_Chr4-2g07127 [Microbotryum saponariae]